VKAAGLTYHRADSVEHAMQLARRFNGSAKLMAGGQSLVPMMNLRMAAAEHVIDISGMVLVRDDEEKLYTLRTDLLPQTGSLLDAYLRS